MERYSTMDFEDVRFCQRSDDPMRLVTHVAQMFTLRYTNYPQTAKCQRGLLSKTLFDPILHASRHILESSENRVCST
jgi:hypothetical protein